jgi:hypothetical protein
MGIRNSRNAYRMEKEHWLPDFSMGSKDLQAEQVQVSVDPKGPTRTETRSTRRVGSALEGRLLQGELALDQVQVVRNDLSDTDIEVQLRRPQPPSPAVLNEAAPVRSGGGGWSFLMQRVFRSGGARP